MYQDHETSVDVSNTHVSGFLQLRIKQKRTEKQMQKNPWNWNVRRNQITFPSSIIFVVLFNGTPVLAFVIKDVTQEKKDNAILAEEKPQSEHLLTNILPEAVTAKLKSGEKFSDITCFFSDMVGSTSLSSDMNLTELVGVLNNIVNGFDVLIDKHHLEKIKIYW